MSAILLHSTGTPPSMWDAAVAAAGKSGRAIANLGYPPNALIERPRLVAPGEDVAHILAAIAGEATIDLVAHSYGGVLALEVAAALEREGRLRTLTIYEPVLYGALAQLADHPDAAALVEFTDSKWTDPAVGGTEPWLAMFIDYWNRPGSWQRLPPPLADYIRSVGWKMYSEVLTCFSPALTFDHPVLARATTTLVTGGRSPAPARAVVAELARRYPAIRVVDLPGIGHMGPVTHPQLVAPILADILAA